MEDKEDRGVCKDKGAGEGRQTLICKGEEDKIWTEEVEQGGEHEAKDEG